jgi:hypothetical protein
MCCDPNQFLRRHSVHPSPTSGVSSGGSTFSSGRLSLSGSAADPLNCLQMLSNAQCVAYHGWVPVESAPPPPFPLPPFVPPPRPSRVPHLWGIIQWFHLEQREVILEWISAADRVCEAWAPDHHPTAMLCGVLDRHLVLGEGGQREACRQHIMCTASSPVKRNVCFVGCRQPPRASLPEHIATKELTKQDHWQANLWGCLYWVDHGNRGSNATANKACPRLLLRLSGNKYNPAVRYGRLATIAAQIASWAVVTVCRQTHHLELHTGLGQCAQTVGQHADAPQCLQNTAAAHTTQPGVM